MAQTTVVCNLQLLRNVVASCKLGLRHWSLVQLMAVVIPGSGGGSGGPPGGPPSDPPCGGFIVPLVSNEPPQKKQRTRKEQAAYDEGLQEGLMHLSRVARQSMDSARNEGFDHGFAKGYGKGMLDGVKEMTNGNHKEK